MLDFEDLRENISDFIEENPLLSRIAAIVLFFFMTALVIILIQTSKPKPKKYERTDIILDSKPLYPDGPDIEKDYYHSRTTKESWSDEEIKQWFTPSDPKMINELEKANDRIVNEITGAAP
jgi:hypothetical protein